MVWFAVGVVLATAGWLATQYWHARGVPPVNAPPVAFVRSYNVRPELAGEIRNALSGALEPMYRVSVASSGQLLVAAPPNVQQGVEEFLQQVAARKPSAAPSVHVEAWFVTASPGARSDSLTIKELEPALHALEQSKGPTRFELLEQLSTQAQSGGQSSDVQGAHASMQVGVTVLHDSQDHPVVTAQLKLRASLAGMTPVPGMPGITAQTELRPGELLVLGQSSVSDRGGSTDRQLYYIVRATL